MPSNQRPPKRESIPSRSSSNHKGWPLDAGSSCRSEVERRSRCSLVDGQEFGFEDEQEKLTLARLAQYSKHVAALGLLHDV